MEKKANGMTHTEQRIIYNNDGDAAGQLTELVDPLAGTGVDTFVLGMFTGNLFLHDTKKGEISGTTPRGSDQMRPKAMDLIARGIDPMQVVGHRAHELGMRFMAGFRMNDLHDVWLPERVCKKKKECPDMLIGDKGKRSDDSLPDYYPPGTNCNPQKFRGFAWNYADPRVIPMRMEILQETVDRYDIDGLELDFLRHPILFPAGDEQKHSYILTDFMKKVRGMLNDTGLKRGKKMELGILVPHSPGLCETVGMEIQAWINEGLLDYIVPRPTDSSSWEVSHQEWLKLTGNRKIQLLGGIFDLSSGDVNVNAGKRYGLCKEAYTGLFSLFKERKLDGVHFFNFDCEKPRNPLSKERSGFLKNILNPDSDIHRKKIYPLCPRADLLAGAAGDVFQLPFMLKRGEKHKLEFYLGGEFGKSSSYPKKIILRTLCQDLSPGKDRFQFSVNGKSVPGGQVQYTEQLVDVHEVGIWWTEPKQLAVVDIDVRNMPLCPGTNSVVMELEREGNNQNTPAVIRHFLCMVEM